MADPSAVRGELVDELEESMHGYGIRVETRMEVASAAIRIVRDRLELALGCNHRFDPECARCEWLEPLKQQLEAVGLLDGSGRVDG